MIDKTLESYGKSEQNIPKMMRKYILFQSSYH